MGERERKSRYVTEMTIAEKWETGRERERKIFFLPSLKGRLLEQTLETVYFVNVTFPNVVCARRWP